MTIENEQGDADDCSAGTPEEDTLCRDATHDPTAHEATAHEDKERKTQYVGGICCREPSHAGGEVDEITVDAYLTHFVCQQSTESEKERAIVEEQTQVGQAGCFFIDH